MLAIGATEWGHLLALISALPLLVPGWRRSRAGRAGVLLSLVAVILALSPLARAALIARHLPADLETAFGVARPTSTSSPATNNFAPRRAAPLSLAPLVPGLGARYAALADAVRREQLVYATRDGQSLSLDLYRPPASPAAVETTPAPCVLVIHGGSWQSGDRTQLAPLNDELAARGYVVAAVDYRLGARHPFPAARDDVQAALDYLKQHAATHGIDATRFVLLGRSAGAQLALLVAYAAHDPAIRGVVSLYGPADMFYGYEHPANPLVFDSRGVLSAYLGGNPANVPAQYAAASPINFADADAPPTLLIHGGRDELVSRAQSERLDARLAHLARPHFLLLLPWATHGCDYNPGGPCGQLSAYAVGRFLARVNE